VGRTPSAAQAVRVGRTVSAGLGVGARQAVCGRPAVSTAQAGSAGPRARARQAASAGPPVSALEVVCRLRAAIGAPPVSGHEPPAAVGPGESAHDARVPSRGRASVNRRRRAAPNNPNAQAVGRSATALRSR
jgi:hypothetical protein